MLWGHRECIPVTHSEEGNRHWWEWCWHRMAAFSALIILLILGGSPMTSSDDGAERTLYDFAGGESVRRFQSINDVVMGGISRGELVALEGEGALFQGVVSLENNGGFASVRSLPEDHRLAGYAGIRLRVKGDGKTYKLTLKTSAALDGVQYQARFQPPAGAWVSIAIPFSAFVPTVRGRVLGEVPPVDPAAILTVGFMISDRQEGPFSLTVARFGAYR